MNKQEIQERLKELDKEIDLHIKIHHSGGNAGVMKLVNCKDYQLLSAESETLRNEYKKL